MSDELVLNGGEVEDDLLNAVDTARDQGKITWLVFEGERVAVLAPVEVGEYYERALAGTLTAAGRHHRAAQAQPAVSD
jgi:hypothetical protein